MSWIRCCVRWPAESVARSSGGSTGYLDHFRARVLQDALTSALVSFWHRRAAQFDEVTGLPPIPLYADQATVERAPASMRVAVACRRHDALIASMRPEPISPAVRAVLEEVAAA